MAFEEVIFEPLRSKPQLRKDEISFKSTAKRSYLRFNQELSQELIDEGFKSVALEWDKDTNELRFKFRKDDDIINLAFAKGTKNITITHNRLCRFIKEKLEIGNEKVIIHISEDKSRVISVQMRYITL